MPIVRDFIQGLTPHSCCFSFCKDGGKWHCACKVAIPKKYLEVYQNLLNEGDTKIKARKQGSELGESKMTLWLVGWGIQPMHSLPRRES